MKAAAHGQVDVVLTLPYLTLPYRTLPYLTFTRGDYLTTSGRRARGAASSTARRRRGQPFDGQTALMF